MIKISDNEIYSNGVKIGWIEGNDVKDHEGHKLGYFNDNDILNASGIKMGYTQGGELIMNNGKIITFENLRNHIQGSVNDIARAAIYVFFGG
ncbi:MAG: hypothetical protein M1334_03755 [Patescibacteria group bacterium]|nr:hypothetical protein [Patescibacteria group bacterium]